MSDQSTQKTIVKSPAKGDSAPLSCYPSLHGPDARWELLYRGVYKTFAVESRVDCIEGYRYLRLVGDDGLYLDVRYPERREWRIIEDNALGE